MEAANQHAQLFERYMEICNQALEQNKEKFPFKQIWEAAQTRLRDQKVALAVYDDSPQETFEVALNGSHLDVSRPECSCKAPWRVNRSYLEQVTSNPEDYIQNPAKIDWGWLQRECMKD